MAAGDEMEVSLSSVLLDSVESKQSGDVLSPEDLAWADSCLVKDSEISDSNWDSLTDSLLHILTLQPDSLQFSAARRDGFTQVSDFEILRSGEEAQTPPDLRSIFDDIVPCNEEEEQNSDDYLDEKTDGINPRSKFRNRFLPNYSEYLKDDESTDPGLDFGFPVVVPDPSSEDIFKVWDLNSPADEDELIEQLNKAIAESSLLRMPSNFNDLGGKDSTNDSLDDLIAGISDLSLNRISG